MSIDLAKMLILYVNHNKEAYYRKEFADRISKSIITTDKNMMITKVDIVDIEERSDLMELIDNNTVIILVGSSIRDFSDFLNTYSPFDDMVFKENKYKNVAFYLGGAGYSDEAKAKLVKTTFDDIISEYMYYHGFGKKENLSLYKKCFRALYTKEYKSN